MAMDGNKMGTEIAQAIIDSGAPPDVQAQVTALWQKIGTVIVTHIQQNAIVPAGIDVATTGSASAQTGKPTAPGKIT
jgi:predicted KAP-like P-loop ATPase